MFGYMGEKKKKKKGGGEERKKERKGKKKESCSHVAVLFWPYSTNLFKTPP
jgi:hypothetical protein